MVCVTRVVLDVLKPHAPKSLEMAKNIASIGEDYHVRLVVDEMDEKTETIKIEITANDIDFDKVELAITEMGAALHSIDEIEAKGQNEVK